MAAKKKNIRKSSITFRRTSAAVSAASLLISAMLIVSSCSKGAESSSVSETEATYSTKVDTTPAVTTTTEAPLVLLPEAQERLAKHPDSAGWITIDGVVDEEVVQKFGDAEQGNSFYIDHGIDGKKSDAGVIFADYRNVLAGSKASDNIILYGHNQKDNTRLGGLDSYKWSLRGPNASISYYKKHAIINFSTNYEKKQYKIFAIFTTNTLPEHDKGNVFDYQNYLEFDTEERYNDFITKVTERSYIKTGIDVKYGDKFLTLSTCDTDFDDARLVVVARQVRDGESADIDFSQCSVNTNYKYPAAFSH
jgi:sortase B